MSEYNNHTDTTINLWRVTQEQTIELIKTYPTGSMHPNCICYRVELPSFSFGGNIVVKYFIEDCEQEWFRELVKDHPTEDGPRIGGSYLLKKMTDLSSLLEGEEE
tara:strand:- start:637 stop:951 length:315 start_codon:yes stop_codon:yes gene_type:complete